MSIYENVKKNYEMDKSYPLEAELPKNMTIEVTNQCNLRCVMCYNKSMKRKKGFMEYALYKRIIDNAIDIGIEKVGLYTIGESFLHPRIFQFINYAKRRGMEYVYITTNGQALKDQDIRAMFISGLDSIKFSIDAGNKKTYEALKPGASWQRLVTTIKKVNLMRDATQSKMKIYASYIVMKDNIDDITSYRNTFDHLIDETLYTMVENQGTLVNTDRYDLGGIIEDTSAVRRHCALPWERFIVTYEGCLTICCTDFENIMLYGDIHREKLEKAWNNDQMRGYRCAHRDFSFENMPMCRNCDAINKPFDFYSKEAIEKILQDRIKK